MNGVWRVAELTQYIKEMFDIDYRLRDVQVEGEISNFTAARSGHWYFTLKDDSAQLKAVMWRSRAQSMRWQPQNGDAVVARGRMTVYAAGGVYQLVADTIEPVGRGDLAVAFERLKAQLAAEGLFDAAHKQPLPRFPRKIGIVTSADAAALRDILNVLRRRYPLVDVLIAPTLVQGPEAPAGIVRALGWLDGRHDIDAIIVSRGGGSMEDLWAFNDEAVARAIFAAKTPVVSGVGHEIDFTIADFVADVRAPTPSAAAELIVPDVMELRPQVDGMQAALDASFARRLEQYRWRVDALRRALTHLSPAAQLTGGQERLTVLGRRLEQGMHQQLEGATRAFDLARARLDAYGPGATLQRGYAIVRRRDGAIVNRTGNVTVGMPLRVTVSDGDFDVEVSDR